MTKFKNGIETTTLKVTSGAPGAGKYLGSDGVGNATWSIPAGGGGSGLTEIDVNGNFGAAYTIATSGAQRVVVHSGVLNVNTAITITGFTTAYHHVLIIGKQDATGGRTLSINDGSGAVNIPLPLEADAKWVITVEWDGADAYVHTRW